MDYKLEGVSYVLTVILGSLPSMVSVLPVMSPTVVSVTRPTSALNVTSTSVPKMDPVLAAISTTVLNARNPINVPTAVLTTPLPLLPPPVPSVLSINAFPAQLGMSVLSAMPAVSWSITVVTLPVLIPTVKLTHVLTLTSVLTAKPVSR